MEEEIIQIRIPCDGCGNVKPTKDYEVFFDLDSVYSKDYGFVFLGCSVCGALMSI